MTASNNLKTLLLSAQSELGRSAVVLERVYEQLLTKDLRELLRNDDLLIDASTARFARTCDILVRKVWRLIKLIETDEQGSIIDIFNYADKIGLFEDDGSMVKIREVRNAIAHDYATEDLLTIVSDVKHLTPSLLEAAKIAAEYQIK